MLRKWRRWETSNNVYNFYIPQKISRHILSLNFVRNIIIIMATYMNFPSLVLLLLNVYFFCIFTIFSSSHSALYLVCILWSILTLTLYCISYVMLCCISIVIAYFVCFFLVYFSSVSFTVQSLVRSVALWPSQCNVYDWSERTRRQYVSRFK